MDDLLILIALALAIPVCAIAGFVMALNLRRRTILLEQRVRTLEAQLEIIAPPPAASVPQAPLTPLEQPTAAEPDSPQQVEPKATTPSPEPTGSVPPIPVPAQFLLVGTSDSGLVGRFGLGASPWRWVGSFSCATRSSRACSGPVPASHLGLLSPRPACRRGMAAPPQRCPDPARHGSGPCAERADCSWYVDRLRDCLCRIRPLWSDRASVALVLLGAVSVLTMLAAALHGPALAALGLVAALASPLLVQTGKPNFWALVGYLALVVLAAYGVARLRLWKWLALAAAFGAIAWTVPLTLGRDVMPAMVHVWSKPVALGTAIVADRVRIRSCATSSAQSVARGGSARVGSEHRRRRPGRTPIVNWLLWGYGVPALAFFLASRVMQRHRRDRVVRFVESLSIVFAALLGFFEIRHTLQGGDLFAPTSDHLERRA